MTVLVIIVDAMGGDNAPEAIVNGCIDALLERNGFEILLVGDAGKIEKIIKERKYSGKGLRIHNATEVIENNDVPVKAIKSKKDSSMVVGLNLLKEKKGEVFLSAGNTGALTVGSMLTLGRIRGVVRPALAPILPAKKSGVMLVDAGINTVCKPVNYLQFGILGSLYMRNVMGIENPRVGLVNVGSEDQKGNETIKQAYKLLSESGINFIGNIEGRDIPESVVDVAVTDGFTGNVALKLMEGVGSLFITELKNIYTSNLLSKISALAVSGSLKKFRRKFDYAEYGGTLILGVDGKVMKTHGSSNAKAVKKSVFNAVNLAQSNIIEIIREQFKDMEVGDIENEI